MTQANTNKRRRWTAWLIFSLIVLGVIAFLLWVLGTGFVKSQIRSQLSELGIGEPKIGSVSLRSDGVTVDQIEFKNANADAPWISLNRVAINHPLSGLAAGDNVFNSLEIEGVRAIVDLSETGSDTPFDLSTLELPTEQLTLRDANIKFTESPPSEASDQPRQISIEGIEGTIIKTESGLILDGQLGDFLGGQWEVAGTADPDENRWNVELNSNAARLVDGQWQNWPGIPDSLGSYIRGNAEASVSVQASSNEQTGMTYEAQFNLAHGNLNLPKFKLPIELQQGSLNVSSGVARYDDFVATTNGKNRISGSGTTRFDAFPIQSNFQAEFRDLDVATLRKLTSTIPTIVVGTATGNISGVVDLEESFRTTVAIEANGRSTDARYGLIKADSANLLLSMTPMVFDSQLEFESIDGRLVVDAMAKEQSAKEVFKTLELEELGNQLEIEAAATGKLSFDLPLATAEKIETWNMKVSATSPAGRLSQQSIRDIRVEARLADGNLKFSEIVATPVASEQVNEKQLGMLPGNAASSAPSIRANVDWPLNSNPSPSDIGKINLNGEGVSPKWLIGLLNRQIQNASDPASVNTAPQAIQLEPSLENLAGSINFQSNVRISANDPSAINKWSAEGAMINSTVLASGQTLNNLETQLALADGVLKLSQASGNFSNGGKLNADVKFDIVAGEVITGRAQTSDMPISWVLGVAAESSTELRNVLNATNFELANLEDDLQGNLSAQFDLTPALSGQDWSVATRINSKQLKIKGETVGNLAVVGRVGSTKIEIESAHAETAGEGQFDLNGNWIFAESSGQADLRWQRLPLSWLAGFATQSNEMVAGTTSGKVQLSRAQQPADREIPINVTGTVNANGLRFANLKSRQLGFDILSDGDAILFDRFRGENDFKEVNLEGRLELTQPFAFSVDGTVTQLPLTRIFERASIADQESIVSVTGNADAKFNLNGDLTTLDWNSKGAIKFGDLYYNDQSLENIESNWSVAANDWAASSVSVKAFGGSMELIELSQQPQRIKVELKDIDSKQLTSLAKLPVKVTGKISGNASLNEWSLADTRWADLNIRGASLLFGPTEFGDLASSVEFRDNQLKYSVDGRLLNGKFTAKGETNVADNLLETQLPINLQFTNGTLSQLYRQSGNLNTLRSLQGTLSANGEWIFQLNRPPTGRGIVKVGNLSWDNEILTKEVSTSVNFKSGRLELSNLRADLQRGEISGRASIPITSRASGNYQLNFRSFNLERLLEVVMDEPIEGAGLMDARISGQIGRSISGQGTVAINRAKLLGQTGRTLQLPIQFQFQPQQNSGHIEFRQSRFRLFNGNVAGSAFLDFGRNINLKTNLRVSKLDTELLFTALAGLKNSGQGDLSGQLVLKGNSIRSLRDLKGSFTGRLDRAAAFELPLLNTIGRFLGGNQLQSNDFESEDIDLRLSQGKIEVRQLNISNSLAQVAVTGNAFVDGRLDLKVAGKIERLNQPTLLEQLAGSPLARFQGSPVALFAQAADFLSERLIFVQVVGTVNRPLVRPDSGKQLQSETIRYFLRGSQIFPNADAQNN